MDINTNKDDDIVDLTSEDILATPQFQPVAMLQPVQLPVTPGSTNTNKDDDIVDITSEDVLAKPPRKGLLPTPNFPPALFPASQANAATAQKRAWEPSAAPKYQPPFSKTQKQSAYRSPLLNGCCYFCKKFTHFVSECPERPKCNFCGEVRHKFNECPKRLAWVENSKLMSRLESLQLIEIKDHSGYLATIDIQKVNFYELVRTTYKTHGHEHGGFLVRPEIHRDIPDITTITNSHVYPYKGFLTKNDEASYSLEQVCGHYMKFKNYRKLANQTDFERSAGYDLGGRSPFWPSMLTFLSKVSESKKEINYVINKGHSFFPKDNVSEWCLRTLDESFTKYLINPNEKLNLPGIDKVDLFIGEVGSLTGWHVEDLNFASVNYLQSGKPKFWVVVSFKYTKSLIALFKVKYPELYKSCPSAQLHKGIVLLPQELLLANIPFKTLKQEPGDYIITFPAGFHFVINSGHNIAEALNFVFDEWELHRSSYPMDCTCTGKFGQEYRKNVADIRKRFKY